MSKFNNLRNEKDEELEMMNNANENEVEEKEREFTLLPLVVPIMLLGLVLLILGICGGIVRNGIDKSHNETASQIDVLGTDIDSDMDEMEEELLVILDKLYAMQGNIGDNMEVLDELRESDLSDEKANHMAEAKNTLEKIKTIQKTLVEISDKNKDMNENLYSDINGDLTSVSSELNSLITEVESILLSRVDSSSNGVVNNINTLKNETVRLIDKLKKENSDQYSDVIEQLETLDSELSTLLNDNFTILEMTLLDEMGNNQDEARNKFSELSGELGELDKKVAANLNELSGDVDETRAHVEYLIEQLRGDVEANQDEIRESFTGIGNKVTELERKLNATLSDLRNMIDTLSKLEIDNQEELLTSLEDVEKSLSDSAKKNADSIHANLVELENNYENLLNEVTEALKNQLDGVSAGISADISNMAGGLSSDLNNMEGNLSTNINDMAGNLSSDINDMAGGLSSDISNMSDTLAQTFNDYSSANSSTLNSLFETLNTNITNNFTTTAGSDGEILERIGDLSNKVDASFTSVSNGKKLVASALLTKGQTVSQDATFQDIYNAIMNIQQDVRFGENLTGEISYDYHYHKDAAGNTVNEASVGNSGGCYVDPIYHVHDGNSASGGGCFSVPVYHTHTGSPSTGGGCYSVYVYHQHNSSCYSECGTTWDSIYGPKDRCPSCDSWVDAYEHTADDGDHYIPGLNDGSDYYLYRCTERSLSCGKAQTLQGYALGCGKTTSTIDGYAPACGMDENTIIGYKTGCGLSHGQIVGAHIVYPTNY